jgi:hypothetical protein
LRLKDSMGGGALGGGAGAGASAADLDLERPRWAHANTPLGFLRACCRSSLVAESADAGSSEWPLTEGRSGFEPAACAVNGASDAALSFRRWTGLDGSERVLCEPGASPYGRKSAPRLGGRSVSSGTPACVGVDVPLVAEKAVEEATLARDWTRRVARPGTPSRVPSPSWSTRTYSSLAGDVPPPTPTLSDAAGLAEGLEPAADGAGEGLGPFFLPKRPRSGIDGD